MKKPTQAGREPAIASPSLQSQFPAPKPDSFWKTRHFEMESVVIETNALLHLLASMLDKEGKAIEGQIAVLVQRAAWRLTEAYYGSTDGKGAE